MTHPATTSNGTPAPPRGRLLLKWSLFLLVLVFVAQRAAQLWRRDEFTGVELETKWLLAAGMLYLTGWLPSVWFWRELINSLGGCVGWIDVARAFFCGHLGKYVPGKAAAVVIRAALLKGRGTTATTAALTATYETLWLIGIGAGVSLALAPWALPAEHWQRLPDWVNGLREPPFLPAALVAAIGLPMLPVVSRLLTALAVRFTPPDIRETASPVRIKTRLLFGGVCAYVLTWACHGLSLACTLRAVHAKPCELADWPVWTAAVAMSVTTGFAAVFAPGGLGVREGLLIEVLRIQPAIGEQQAIVAAILLRAVWLVAEVAAAGVLYYLVRLWLKRPASELGRDAPGTKMTRHEDS
jgi:hypothetical protein